MIHKILAIRKFYAPKRISTIFRGKILVSQYRKTSWGNAFVFQKISSTEKHYGEERRRECHVFPSEIVSPKPPENIVGEPFCFSEMF